MSLKRVNLVLDERNVSFLREWAQKTGKSQSELVRLTLSKEELKESVV